MPRNLTIVTKHLEPSSSTLVDGELKSYREDTEKRACIMTEGGPIWIEPSYSDDGWTFSITFPDHQELTHNEFDWVNGPLEVD